MRWTEICQQLYWLRHSQVHPRTSDVLVGPYFIGGRWETLAVAWDYRSRWK